MTLFGTKSSPSTLLILCLLIKLNFFFYEGWSAKLLSQNQTMLTLHTHQVTWLEACAVCQSLGGGLLNIRRYGIDEESTRSILQSLLKTDPWKANIADNEDLWTGLYKDDTRYKTLQWSDACGRENISARSVFPATLQCLSLVGGASWIPRPCDFKIKFICEQESDMPCTFEAILNKYDVTKFLFYAKKWAPTTENCILDCWNQNTCGYVVYHSSTGICIMMTIDEHKRATSSFVLFDTVAYKKICANASVIIYSSTDMEPLEQGVSRFPINTDGDTFSESTFDESTNNISNFTDSTVTVSSANESTNSMNNVSESTVTVSSPNESTNSMNNVSEFTVTVSSANESTNSMNNVSESTVTVSSANESTNSMNNVSESTVSVSSANESTNNMNNVSESTVAVSRVNESTTYLKNVSESTVSVNSVIESTNNYVVVSTVTLNSVDERTENMNTMALNTIDDSTNTVDKSTVVVSSADDCLSTMNNSDKSTADSSTSGDLTSGMNTNKQCYCTCNVTYMSANRKIFLDHVLQPLNINISILSSTRRKYVSVKDNRQSARNVGFFGVLFLFGSLLVIPLLDCVTLLGVLCPRFCRLTRGKT